MPQNLMPSWVQFHIFEQGKAKNQTRSHRHHLQDNIAMYNVYVRQLQLCKHYSIHYISVNTLPCSRYNFLANLGNSGLKWTILDIQTFKFPGKGSLDFVVQVEINGCHTVILVPPSCSSNIVLPFHNLTKAPICVVIKTLK